MFDLQFVDRLLKKKLLLKQTLVNTLVQDSLLVYTSECRHFFIRTADMKGKSTKDMLLSNPKLDALKRNVSVFLTVVSSRCNWALTQSITASAQKPRNKRHGFAVDAAAVAAIQTAFRTSGTSLQITSSHQRSAGFWPQSASIVGTRVCYDFGWLMQRGRASGGGVTLESPSEQFSCTGCIKICPLHSFHVQSVS